VLIPTRNEEATVEAAVRSAWDAGAAEVIVADGGSTDATVDRARSAGADVFVLEAARGARVNRAAQRAQRDILLFLHADSLLAPGSLQNVVNAIRQGYLFGGFRIQFCEPSVRLRLAAALINLRTSLTRCPWGDQAQFIVRNAFLDQGGFRDDPIMEDYDLAVRMNQLGRTILLPDTVRTSGRRFLERGVLHTAAVNWRIVMLYRRGRDPRELERLYRR
jgi:rSAM/selenodomain-associated transferase 2